MKRILTAVALGLVCGGLLLGWGWRLWVGPGPAGEGRSQDPQRVRITSGMTLGAAADTLAGRGLLRRPAVLRIGARLSGRGRDLRAGLYEVPPGLSARGLLELLTGGPTVQVKVTVPEGWNAVEAATVIADSLGLDPEAFLAAADAAARAVMRDRGLLDADGAVAAYEALLVTEAADRGRVFHGCEGYLAPDTYHFAEGVGAESVAASLVASQAARLDSVLALPRPEVTADLTAHEILTLASIVEAEARLASERARIAAVYVNRLTRGRRLEADPTVAFVLGKKGQRLFFRDLETASAFNTYRRSGLPPGPIGAPGLASLEAAARPDTSSRDLYFVSDGETGHLFAATLAEHEENVRRFRNLRAADRRRQD